MTTKIGGNLGTLLLLSFLGFAFGLVSGTTRSAVACEERKLGYGECPSTQMSYENCSYSGRCSGSGGGERPSTHTVVGWCGGIAIQQCDGNQSCECGGPSTGDGCDPWDPTCEYA